VDDDLDEIAGGLDGCLKRRSDFVVVVGGLGPTPDDMTLKGIAGATGGKMKLNEAALALIREHYARRNMSGIEMTPSRRKMAILPAGAEPVRNETGTAPGVRLTLGRTTVFCLPGVPSEMRHIFRRSVEPEIAERLGELHRKSVTLKVEGIYESTLAPIIGAALRRHPGAYIKSHPRGIREGKSRIELDVATVSEERAEAEGSTAQIVRELRRDIEASGAMILSEKGVAS